jgi:excisionase family DNA binding protein
MNDSINDKAALFLQTPDLAERINVSTRTIERWRKDGLIPYLKIGRRVVLHRLSDVLKALENFDYPTRARI